jgi:hypothetical protein
MDAWRKSDVGGELVIVDSLVRRRTAEKALFLKELPQVAAPSVFVRPQLDHAASILGAPVNYTPVPEVGSIAPTPAKPEPAQRLTEILKNEPATEALLLTQVVANDPVAEEETEITTAHAKPVSRFDFEPRIAPRRSTWLFSKASAPTENANETSASNCDCVSGWVTSEFTKVSIGAMSSASRLCASFSFTASPGSVTRTWL